MEAQHQGAFNTYPLYGFRDELVRPTWMIMTPSRADPWIFVSLGVSIAVLGGPRRIMGSGPLEDGNWKLDPFGRVRAEKEPVESDDQSNLGWLSGPVIL